MTTEHDKFVESISDDFKKAEYYEVTINLIIDGQDCMRKLRIKKEEDGSLTEQSEVAEYVSDSITDMVDSLFEANK